MRRTPLQDLALDLRAEIDRVEAERAAFAADQFDIKAELTQQLREAESRIHELETELAEMALRLRPGPTAAEESAATRRPRRRRK